VTTVSPTLAPTAFLSVLSTSIHFQGSLFLLGTSSYESEVVVKDINLHQNQVLGHDAYIIFGQNRKFTRNIDLRSGSTPKITPVLFRDSSSRSATIVGDINGDGYRDMIIGYPFSSLVLVYRGKKQGFTNLVTSFLIRGEPESEFGWAVSGLGDINDDHYDDFIISAKAIGVLYVFFGKGNIMNRNIDVTKLTVSQGFKITGSTDTFNAGVSVAGAGDFNKDGFKDIIFSAMTASSQGIVYILFGNKTFHDVSLSQLSNSVLLVISCPVSSLSGLSVTGIGDIDNDGYDDIAISSLPYKGGYQTQKTYLIYGRSVVRNEKLDLTQMIEGIDGITITGGGFMVGGGEGRDFNNDGLADLMIINYPFWQGKSSAYFLQFPDNVTSSPTLAPSSFPSSQPTSFPSLLPTIAMTTHTPSNLPTRFSTQSAGFSPSQSNYNSSNNNNKTSSSVYIPPTLRPTRQPKSFRPTPIPTIIPSPSPTQRPTHRPSSSPRPTPIPSEKPSSAPVVPETAMPTLDFRRLRGSVAPSPVTTSLPTINTTAIEAINCNKAGEYQGRNETNYQFSISANVGTVSITGNAQAGIENVYLLQTCPSDRVDVEIKNFRISTDRINVAYLIESGYVYPSLSEISFSVKSGQPLTLLFCEENKLQMILSSHSTFELTDRNFLFAPWLSEMNGQQSTKDSVLTQIQIGIAFGMITLFVLCVWITKVAQQSSVDEKEIKDIRSDDEEEEENHSYTRRGYQDSLAGSDSLGSGFTALLLQWDEDGNSEVASDYDGDCSENENNGHNNYNEDYYENNSHFHFENDYNVGNHNYVYDYNGYGSPLYFGFGCNFDNTNYMNDYNAGPNLFYGEYHNNYNHNYNFDYNYNYNYNYYSSSHFDYNGNVFASSVDNDDNNNNNNECSSLDGNHDCIQQNEEQSDRDNNVPRQEDLNSVFFFYQSGDKLPIEE
jgi:hypothetical protein